MGRGRTYSVFGRELGDRVVGVGFLERVDDGTLAEFRLANWSACWRELLLVRRHTFWDEWPGYQTGDNFTRNCP